MISTIFADAYAELSDIIGRPRNAYLGRVVQNNTRARREGVDLVIKYHATDIIRYSIDGRGQYTITIDTAGYHTVTTAARYAEWLPRGYHVANHNGRWNVYGPGVEVTATSYDGSAYTYRPPVPYFRIWDSMTISDTPRPRVLNYLDGPDMVKRDLVAAGITADIAQYVALYSDARISELRDGDDIGAGDCWLCLFMDTNGTDNGHILEHFREGYTMAAMVRNAYAVRGYGPAAMFMFDPVHVRGELTRYLKSRLVPHGIPAADADRVRI